MIQTYRVKWLQLELSRRLAWVELAKEVAEGEEEENLKREEDCSITDRTLQAV
jgi:hypothetical protein